MAYLRAVHYHEPEPELPQGAANLALLVREANFYALPGLARAAQVPHAEPARAWQPLPV